MYQNILIFASAYFYLQVYSMYTTKDYKFAVLSSSSSSLLYN